jgi:2-oxoglutarate ferredoxin oxidoreductase subunit gamma
MSGGVLAINASLVDRLPKREDVDAIMVPADEVAEEIGDRRLANMVMVGALVDRLRVLSRKEISDSLRAHIPAHRRDMLQGNLEALRRGGEYALAS